MARRRGPRRVAGGSVQISGLRELTRALKHAEQVAPKAINEVNNRIAQEVVDAAKGRASSVSAQARKAAESLKAGRGATRATIALGGARHPFALGAEFGSVRYPQFMAWRGSGSDAGYFLYPTIRDKRSDIEKKYLDAIEELLK